MSLFLHIAHPSDNFFGELLKGRDGWQRFPCLEMGKNTNYPISVRYLSYGAAQ